MFTEEEIANLCLLALDFMDSCQFRDYEMTERNANKSVVDAALAAVEKTDPIRRWDMDYWVERIKEIH